MFKLLLSTIGLSCTDCVDPLAFSVVIYLLTTKRPTFNAVCFLLGILLTTFAAGLILAFGVIKEVDTLLAHPHGTYFGFQLAIGLFILFAAWKYWHHTSGHKSEEVSIKINVTPPVAFFLGVAFTATDLPTNVPLLAVADALVKENASAFVSSISCLAYAIVRIFLPALIVLIYVVKQEKSAAIIDKMQGPLLSWGHKFTVFILGALGLLLVADSGFFFIAGKALLLF